LCIIKFEKNPDFIVHYNALLSDMIFNKIIPNRLYSYFISQTNLSPDNFTVLDQSNFHDIIRICNILPVGLYDITSSVIKHYFLIVKFSESDYSIISAYGNERIQVELIEHPITLELLTQFVTNVNTGNIQYVRNFILHYFLNDTQTYIGEVSSYVGQLQLYYFHNLVGQIETTINSHTGGGGHKKRKCMSLTNKRCRKYRYSSRHRSSTKRTTRRTRHRRR
jgi:hypothetical protein